ncbi:MAG TPA: molybdenum ABC transporter ATP-binding protein [Candidatus Sulfotelmatobacter sp.]|nr:molybdenum ABC transporter ATP-binding protein [Candidatus Sulfotelmatobacter sp.]
MSNIRIATQVAEASGRVSSEPPLLRARFEKHFRSSHSHFLLDVDFEVPPGFTILFGASGAGKTTMLDCLAGLSTPDFGTISLGERILFEASSSTKVSTADRRVGYVFQTLALFPHMTVEENVAYGIAHLPRDERSGRVASLFAAFRIPHLAARKATSISGGESQRVALARTLVTDPEFLLMDEPLAALDAPTKARIIDDLRGWNRTHGIPILYVTHSREEVFALGERVIVLDGGRVLAQGTPHAVLHAPYMETVAQLAGFENIFDAVVEAVRPERGTMTCRISGEAGGITLETPLVRGGVGSTLRVGIRAGDILLAISPPTGLSARNLIPGRIQSMEQRDVIISALVKCRVPVEVHLTMAARDSLGLVPGKEVWLVIKTHSCHLMQP